MGVSDDVQAVSNGKAGADRFDCGAAGFYVGGDADNGWLDGLDGAGEIGAEAALMEKRTVQERNSAEAV